METHSQYSFLENPMSSGAWWAIGLQSMGHKETQLKQLSTAALLVHVILQPSTLIKELDQL